MLCTCINLNTIPFFLSFFFFFFFLLLFLFTNLVQVHRSVVIYCRFFNFNYLAIITLKSSLFVVLLLRYIFEEVWMDGIELQVSMILIPGMFLTI